MTSSAPRPNTLSQLVDRSRLDTGELDGTAEALTDGRDAYTWSTYVERVERTAGVLIGARVQPGDRVGIRLSKSVESFVAVHAVLRAGAVVVPVDPQAPTDHAASVLADAGAVSYTHLRAHETVVRIAYAVVGL